MRSAGNPDTLAMIRARIDPPGMRQERWRTEEGWLKNRAYFGGQQHFYIEDGRIVDATADIPEHRVVYKVNLTRMAVVRAAAKILNVNGEFRAVPQSGSAKHRNIAEVSEKLFDHLRQATGWNDNTQLVGTMWAAICGSVFYKVYWDPLAGDPERFYLSDPKTKAVVSSLTLKPEEMHAKDREGLFQDRPKGEVCVEIESPFAVYHDWSSRDRGVAGCKWMATRKFVDTDLVAERWNVDASDLVPEDTANGLTNYEEAIAFMSSSMAMSPFNYGTPDDKRGKRVMYVDMWERPSAQYKKGRRVVYAGKRILYDSDNPYAGDKSGLTHLPWVKQDWTPSPGRFWGGSLVEDLTSPQHAVNDARACLLEFLRVFGRPATYIPSNSGLDPKEITIDPGGVYTISALSKPPTFSPTPQLPPAVTDIGVLCQADLNMIASQSDIDGSKLPSALRSGEALRQMSEQRDIALTVSSKAALIATRDVGRMGLGLCQMFYRDQRTLRYLGDNREWNFVDFTGADLTNDIIIEGEPSLLNTSAQQRAELLDVINAGGLDPINNADDRALFLSGMHYRTNDQIMEDKLRAQKHAEDAIRDMIADPLRYGEVGYPVMPWQDAEREARVLANFMYTREFQKLPPMTQSVITMYWMSLAQLQMAKAAEEQAAVASTKGAPSQPGKASQPSNAPQK